MLQKLIIRTYINTYWNIYNAIHKFFRGFKTIINRAGRTNQKSFSTHGVSLLLKIITSGSVTLLEVYN